MNGEGTRRTFGQFRSDNRIGPRNAGRLSRGIAGVRRRSERTAVAKRHSCPRAPYFQRIIFSIGVTKIPLAPASFNCSITSQKRSSGTTE